MEDGNDDENDCGSHSVGDFSCTGAPNNCGSNHYDIYCTFISPKCALITVVMDESGSMGGEQDWIEETLPDIFSGLSAKGYSQNHVCRVGFGNAAYIDAPEVIDDYGCKMWYEWDTLNEFDD